jgi:ABC-2 type transport system permease protein
MLLFGFVMQRFPHGDLPGGLNYLSFLVPGVCGMTVIFGASQCGIGFIRDLQTGFLPRVLTTPAPVSAILTGKIAADSFRILIQASLVFCLGLALGARFPVVTPGIFQACLAYALLCVALCGVSCWIAAVAKKPEVMGTYVHVVNMPMIFTSVALVPYKSMPPWLESIAAANPLSLAVRTMRVALTDEGSVPAWSLAILFVFAVLSPIGAARALKGVEE